MKRPIPKLVLAGVLGLSLALVAVPVANATGSTSRNCATYGIGSGSLLGLSNTAYGYTQKSGVCGLSVTVQVEYQVYPGGPYAWTGVTSGASFARIDQIYTVGAEHCSSGVFCFPT